MIEVRQEILRQGTELRRKQDARLAAQQHRSAILGGAAITVGALISAVVASPVSTRSGRDSGRPFYGASVCPVQLAPQQVMVPSVRIAHECSSVVARVLNVPDGASVCPSRL